MTKLGTGARVLIEWGGRWWTGKIKRVTGDRYQVKYDGHGGTREEEVFAERLRPAPVRVRNAHYAVDDPVIIEWGGQWWDGTVVGVRPRDRYRVAYAGFGDAWQETLDAARLRNVPGAPARKRSPPSAGREAKAKRNAPTAGRKAPSADRKAPSAGRKAKRTRKKTPSTKSGGAVRRG